MEGKQRDRSFKRRVALVDNRPHIYVLALSEESEASGKQLLVGRDGDTAGEDLEGTRLSASFFGHHIGRLLAPDKATEEEFLSIDKEIETSLESVRKKLQKARPLRLKGGELSKEEIKHERFIKERNSAQEALFEDIVGRHREFGTGLTRDDLWSLHDLMVMEANHEAVCSQEGSIHELVECDLLQFLRKKARERAWDQLEDYLARFKIPFPISPSLEDPSESTRTEEVREERKKSARIDFLKMPADQMAELILGNVPSWVYSYPQKGTYLWELTVLQGVAAGLAANYLMRYLTAWEERSAEILNKVEQGFRERIDQIRRRGESATDLVEVLAITKEVHRISKEEMPKQIWDYIRADLKDA